MARPERRLKVGLATLGAAAMLLFAAPCALAQKVEVLWLGHATFRITSTTGKVIVIDPFLKNNPRTPAKYKDLAALGKVDLILITHGHQDHISDAPELARLTGAPVLGPYELILNFVSLGLIEAGKAFPMNKGGRASPLGPGIKIHVVPAQHSSGLDLVAVKPEIAKPARFLDGGQPIGFVIEFENGFRIYDTGDTDVFGDMALINKFLKPDLALVAIGGYYGMDPEAAAYAMRELVKPRIAVPMHFGTFPAINRTPAEFKAALGSAPIRVVEAKPGEALSF